MTPDREKLREDVARLIEKLFIDAGEDGLLAHIGIHPVSIADAAIALIRPAAMREAAEVGERLIKDAYNAGFCEGMREHTGRNGGIPWCDSVAKKKGATDILALSLLSPDAEKEEGQ